MKTLRALLPALLLIGTTTLRGADVVNGIAVLVNDSIITYQDVKLFIAPAVDALLRQYGTAPGELERRLAETERDGIEQLVERQLILDEFNTKGYNLPESVIEEEVQRRIREGFGDQITLTRTLKARGITKETFRKQIRDQFIIEAMRFNNAPRDPLISPAKIEGYYREHQDRFRAEDQVKLRMIVLNRTRADDADTTRRRAEEILTKLDQGADFVEMATVYSDGSQRAQGGDWGWVEKSVLRRELADVAFSLKAGQRSSIVETPPAYYIMLVEEVREARVKPIAEVREEIERILKSEETSRRQKEWVERLKEDAFIRYF